MTLTLAVILFAVAVDVVCIVAIAVMVRRVRRYLAGRRP